MRNGKPDSNVIYDLGLIAWVSLEAGSRTQDMPCNDAELINFHHEQTACEHRSPSVGFQHDAVQGEDLQRETLMKFPASSRRRLRLVNDARDLDAGAVSVRLHHSGPQCAKPKVEAVADILLDIRERRAQMHGQTAVQFSH